MQGKLTFPKLLCGIRQDVPQTYTWLQALVEANARLLYSKGDMYLWGMTCKTEQPRCQSSHGGLVKLQVKCSSTKVMALVEREEIRPPLCPLLVVTCRPGPY